MKSAHALIHTLRYRVLPLSFYLSLFLSFYDSWTVFLYYIWYNWLDDLCLLVSLSHLLKKLGSSMKNYSIKVKYCERVFWRNKIHSRRLIKFAFNRILVSQYFQLLWIGSNWNSILVILWNSNISFCRLAFYGLHILLCKYFLWKFYKSCILYHHLQPEVKRFAE